MTRKRWTTRAGHWAAPALAAALLVAVGFDTARRNTPDNTDPYHQRIAAAAAKIPAIIGNWAGKDQSVPREAMALLKPNVLLNRVYLNDRGEAAGFMLVQCRDARDMGGHYPPACYPGQGWQLNWEKDARPRRWNVGGTRDAPKMTIDGHEYTFRKEGLFDKSQLTIYNFLILPTGTTTGRIDQVRRVAADYRMKYYGAGQVQVLFYDPGMEPRRRDEIFAELVGANLDVIQAILDGGFQP